MKTKNTYELCRRCSKLIPATSKYCGDCDKIIGEEINGTNDIGECDSIADAYNNLQKQNIELEKEVESLKMSFAINEEQHRKYIAELKEQQVTRDNQEKHIK